jgi:hypothetical protein
MINSRKKTDRRISKWTENIGRGQRSRGRTPSGWIGESPRDTVKIIVDWGSSASNLWEDPDWSAGFLWATLLFNCDRRSTLCFNLFSNFQQVARPEQMKCISGVGLRQTLDILRWNERRWVIGTLSYFRIENTSRNILDVFQICIPCFARGFGFVYLYMSLNTGYFVWDSFLIHVNHFQLFCEKKRGNWMNWEELWTIIFVVCIWWLIGIPHGTECTDRR